LNFPNASGMIRMMCGQSKKVHGPQGTGKNQ
jgi:hypothetical protein